MIWRALTLVQPMATAIAIGVKDIENRSTPIGRKLWPAWVGLHAGKGWRAAYHETCVRLAPNYPWDQAEAGYAPQGAMLGAVRFDWIEQIPTSKVWLMEETRMVALRGSPWTSGPWCLHVAEVRTFETPIPCRGMLGLWTVPQDVADALYEIVPEIA